MHTAQLILPFSLLLTTTGCVSTKTTALREVATSEVVPLSKSLSTTPNQGIICARINNQGVLGTLQCPPLLQKLFRYDYVDQKRPNGHDYALYRVDAGVFLPTVRINLEQRYANERIWYGGWYLQQKALKPDATSSQVELSALRGLCTVGQTSFDAVVQQVEEGCSRTHFGTTIKAGQVVWSLEALGLGGYAIGNGTFLSKHSGKESFTPACTHKAPVAIHVLSREGFCASYVTPVLMQALLGRVSLLTQQLAQAQRQLARARGRIEGDDKTINALDAQLQTLRQQKALSDKERAELVRKVADLKKTHEERSRQIEDAERLLEVRQEALDAAQLEIEMLTATANR